MRKSFKHILLAGLTIASTAMAMNAQTLTQDWKVTEGLPTAGNARWVGCSKFRYKSDIKSARIQLVKLLTFNTLYCEIVL